MENNREFIVLPHVRWVVNSDGAVLLDTKSESMFSVNTTGGLMWKYLVEGHGREEIVRSICTECRVEREQIMADLDVFLVDLENKHLLYRIHSREV